MPDDSYRLRRVPAPDAPSGSGRNNKSPANAVAADAAAVEDIIRRTLQEVQQTPGATTSTSNGNPTSTPPGSSSATVDPPAAPNPSSPSNSNTEDIASVRTQLAGLQKSYNEAIAALEQGRMAYQALEHKHQQFVDANVAFTHWRDDMERQRAAWADANAKFAKRHEEHKAARANLEAKYSAVLADLEDLKGRYDSAKKEIERLSGQTRPESPPLPSAVSRAGAESLGPLEKRKKSIVSGASGIAAATNRAVRGVERDLLGGRQPAYPPPLVEQSVLRERLTSDMFTLSQKVLEERATRAEEARQMAERRIFELESQLAGHPSAISPTTTTSSGCAPSSSHPRSPPALQPSSTSPYQYNSSSTTTTAYAHSPRGYPPPPPQPRFSPYPPSPRDRDPPPHHHQQHHHHQPPPPPPPPQHHHHGRYQSHHHQAPPPPPPPSQLQHSNLPPPALAPATIDSRRTLPPLHAPPPPASSVWRSPGQGHHLPSVNTPPLGSVPPPLTSAHSSTPPPLPPPSRRRGRGMMDLGALVDGEDAEEAARRKKRRSDSYQQHQHAVGAGTNRPSPQSPS